MLKPGYFFSWIRLCCLLLFLAGCEKKGDESPPQIKVTSPAYLDTFMVGDSIPVVALISHTTEITSIKISLVNDDGIPLLVPKYIYPASTSYELNNNYFINKNLASGTYSLLISAGDGSNTAKVYTAVMITGVGRYFEQALAVCSQSSMQTHLYAIDAGGNYANVLSMDHGYTDSDISTGQRQMYYLRPSPDILYAYDLDSLSIDFSVTAAPPHPEFNSVRYTDERAYVCNGNGEVRGYDQYGTPHFITPSNIDTVPVISGSLDSYILAFTTRRGGPERFIRQYYTATGVYRTAFKIYFNVLDIFDLGVDKALLFGNNDTTCRVQEYDASNNVLYSEINMPPGLINHVVRVTSAAYLLSHEQGIYLYDHDDASLVLWLDNTDVDAMAYDDLRQYVYLANGEKVLVYRYSDAVLLQEITLPYPVLKLLIQYNN